MTRKGSHCSVTSLEELHTQDGKSNSKYFANLKRLQHNKKWHKLKLSAV